MAGTLNIHSKMAMKFAADDRGTINAFKSVGKNISKFALEDDDPAFTDEQL